MSEENGTSPPIEIDLNRITRLEYRQFLTEMGKTEDGVERDKLTARLVHKVVLRWPYDEPISESGYLNLGLSDALTVDEALMDALQFIGKKK